MEKKDNPLRQSGAWPWLLQRITAVLLIVFLFTHLALVHYINTEQITFDLVHSRLSTAIIFVDVSLLGFALFHALLGIRAIVYDYNIGEGKKKAITGVLALAGIAAFVYGAYGLWGFL